MQGSSGVVRRPALALLTPVSGLVSGKGQTSFPTGNDSAASDRNSVLAKSHTALPSETTL
jgi:hypothetical protein